MEEMYTERVNTIEELDKIIEQYYIDKAITGYRDEEGMSVFLKAFRIEYTNF